MARRKVDKTMAEIKYSYTRYRRACEEECYHCGGVGWLGVPDELCICEKEGLRADPPPVTEGDQDEGVDDGIF